jgi:hypothetical protein
MILSDYRMLNDKIINEGYERKMLWPNLSNYSSIFLEGLMKTMRNLNQDSQCLGWNLNLGPPKYKAGGQSLDKIILGGVYLNRSVCQKIMLFFSVKTGILQVANQTLKSTASEIAIWRRNDKIVSVNQFVVLI